MMRDRTPFRAARLAAVAPSLALAVALAAWSSTPVSAADPWFAIELIVFDDLEGVGLHAEVWPADPGEPPVDDAVELGNSSQQGRAFGLTPRSDLRLRDTWGALRRSSRYRPPAPRWMAASGSLTQRGPMGAHRTAPRRGSRRYAGSRRGEGFARPVPPPRAGSALRPTPRRVARYPGRCGPDAIPTSVESTNALE